TSRNKHWERNMEILVDLLSWLSSVVPASLLNTQRGHLFAGNPLGLYRPKRLFGNFHEVDVVSMLAKTLRTMWSTVSEHVDSSRLLEHLVKEFAPELRPSSLGERRVLIRLCDAY